MNDQQAIDPKVISRIQKMLNLARDGAAHEGEARNAMDAAEATMRKYNLTMAEVEAAGGNGGEGSKRTKEGVKGRAQYEFQQQLMAACAEVNYCAVLKTSMWKGNRSMVTGYVLIGREGNVVATRELYDYLNATVERLAFEYVGRDNRQRLSRTAISFKKGCAERLGERLVARHAESLEEQAREARERSAAARHPASTGTALVIVMKDFAQEEMDANDDMRWGLVEGTTAAERKRNTAEASVISAINRALRTILATDRNVLMEAALAGGRSTAEALGVPAERLMKLAEYLVNQRLEALHRPEVKPETEAQRAKREEKERRDNERWNERARRERARRERDRELRNTDWTAKNAGSRAGEHVGLDKQVNERNTAPVAGRLK